MSTKQTTLEEDLRKIFDDIELTWLGNGVDPLQPSISGTVQARKKILNLITQRENALLERVIDMLEEKPGELGWSRSFNERLIKKLEAIKEENV